MRSIDVFFSSPLLLLLIIPAVLVLFAAYRWMRRGEGERRVEQAALALRTAQVVLLVLLCAGLNVVTNSSDTAMTLLVDDSQSMEAAAQDAQAFAEAVRSQAGEGNTVRVLQFADKPSEEGAQLDARSTNIAEAIAQAQAALPENVNRRIVLLSDGAATDGDHDAAAKAAAQAGVRLDAVYFDTMVHTPEVEMTRLTMPQDVSEGQKVSAVVAAQANAPMDGVLRITDGEETVYEQDVALIPGGNSFSCALTAKGVGMHALRAELICAQDSVKENNARYAGMRVSSSAKILVVDGTGTQADTIVQLLRDGGSSVDTTSPQEMPQTVSALCEYGLVILMNVAANDLPEGSGERLREYVSEYGRSVLTTGGENTYIYGAMKGSEFEEFLPVKMSVEEKESADPVALMLVIDVTDSMTRQSMGTPIEMARRGAIKCIDALNINDYAGVITFSDDAQMLVEMTPMSGKDAVIEAINGIETADPNKLTKFSGALTMARDTMTAFDKLERRHVIFITDGSPADKDAGFQSIVKEMKNSGVTMSTIVVGRIMNVVQLLDELSAIGGGRCYFVEGANDLPDIMSTDTVLSQVEYTIDQPVMPKIASPVFPIEDETAVTQLYGYIRTAAKPGASVALQTPEGRPLYACWDYGMGRAASFMSDLSGDWSYSWLSSEKGRKLVWEMIRALVPDTLSQTGTDVTLSAGGTRGEISISDTLKETETVQAQITAPDGTIKTVQLEKRGGGQFASQIDLDASGVYMITLTALDAQGAQLDVREAFVVHDWSREYAVFSRKEGAVTLMELAGMAGGAVVASPEELLAIDMGAAPTQHDAALPIAILLMALMLMDIALRQTKAKRLRVWLKKLQGRNQQTED